MTHTPAHPTRLLKSWGDEAVIFDTASGDTHYLKPLTLALYQACRAHPGFNANELAAALATQLNVSQSDSFQELVDETLDTLRRIGLLAPA